MHIFLKILSLIRSFRLYGNRFYREFCSIAFRQMQAGTGPLYRLNEAFAFIELVYTEIRQYIVAIYGLLAKWQFTETRAMG